MVSYKPIRLDAKYILNTCYTDDGGDGEIGLTALERKNMTLAVKRLCSATIGGCRYTTEKTNPSMVSPVHVWF